MIPVTMQVSYGGDYVAGETYELDDDVAAPLILKNYGTIPAGTTFLASAGTLEQLAAEPAAQVVQL